MSSALEGFGPRFYQRCLAVARPPATLRKWFKQIIGLSQHLNGVNGPLNRRDPIAGKWLSSFLACLCNMELDAFEGPSCDTALNCLRLDGRNRSAWNVIREGVRQCNWLKIRSLKACERRVWDVLWKRKETYPSASKKGVDRNCSNALGLKCTICASLGWENAKYFRNWLVLYTEIPKSGLGVARRLLSYWHRRFKVHLGWTGKCNLGTQSPWGRIGLRQR